jgi:hypothetical protein
VGNVPDHIDPRLIELERLLVRRYAASATLLDVDMFDRWGAAHASEEQIAEMTRRATQAEAEYRETTTAIGASVRALRQEAPEIVATWADAHVQLLTELIAASGEDERASTTRFVADEERRAWGEVKAGTRDVVEENCFYVRVDPTRRRSLLGV